MHSYNQKMDGIIYTRVQLQAAVFILAVEEHSCTTRMILYYALTVRIHVYTRVTVHRGHLYLMMVYKWA